MYSYINIFQISNAYIISSETFNLILVPYRFRSTVGSRVLITVLMRMIILIYIKVSFNGRTTSHVPNIRNVFCACGWILKYTNFGLRCLVDKYAKIVVICWYPFVLIEYLNYATHIITQRYFEWSSLMYFI